MHQPIEGHQCASEVREVTLNERLEHLEHVTGVLYEMLHIGLTNQVKLNHNIREIYQFLKQATRDPDVDEPWKQSHDEDS